MPNWASDEIEIGFTNQNLKLLLQILKTHIMLPLKQIR